MTNLTFSADEIRPLIEHARRCNKHRMTYGQLVDACGGNFDRAARLTDEERAELPDIGPGLFLVKDEGIYLMSNGEPADMIKVPAPNGNGETDRCRVAYAKNFDPTARDRGDVWDDAYAVSADDFSEAIGDEMWRKLLTDEVDEVVIKLTDSSISFTAYARK